MSDLFPVPVPQSHLEQFKKQANLLGKAIHTQIGGKRLRGNKALNLYSVASGYPSYNALKLAAKGLTLPSGSLFNLSIVTEIRLPTMAENIAQYSEDITYNTALTSLSHLYEADLVKEPDEPLRGFEKALMSNDSIGIKTIVIDLTYDLKTIDTCETQNLRFRVWDTLTEACQFDDEFDFPLEVFSCPPSLKVKEMLKGLKNIVKAYACQEVIFVGDIDGFSNKILVNELAESLKKTNFRYFSTPISDNPTKPTATMFRVKGELKIDDSTESTSFTAKNILTTGTTGSGALLIAINQALACCEKTQSFYFISMYDDSWLGKQINVYAKRNGLPYHEAYTEIDDTIATSMGKGISVYKQSSMGTPYNERILQLTNLLNSIYKTISEGSLPTILLAIDGLGSILQDADLLKVVTKIAKSQTPLWVCEAYASNEADDYRFTTALDFTHIFHKSTLSMKLVSTGYISTERRDRIENDLDVGQCVVMNENVKFNDGILSLPAISDIQVNNHKTG